MKLNSNSGSCVNGVGHPGQVHDGRDRGEDPLRVPRRGQRRLPQGAGLYILAIILFLLNFLL